MSMNINACMIAYRRSIVTANEVVKKAINSQYNMKLPN